MLKSPSQIIADCLPLGPDAWISDRDEAANMILKRLKDAGYLIGTIRKVERRPFVIEDE